MQDIEANQRAPATSFVTTSDMALKLQLDKKKYKSKVRQMEENRQDYLKRWKAIRDYQLPYIGCFDDTADTTDYARRRDTNIYHSVAWQANQSFAAGVMSGLTPPSRQWFRLIWSNDTMKNHPEAGELLDKRMNILQDVLLKSNFYNAIHSSYLELAFGQAPLAIFQDADTGVHFVPFTVGTYMMENGPDGIVDTFCTKYEMTARQLADKFGADRLPSSIRAELENGGVKTKHKLWWLVEPNRFHDRNKEVMDKYHMKYLSLYWLEEGEKDFLDIGGFQEWPIPVARYLVTGSETYGKGPGWFAEGDSKGLQKLEKDDIIAVELGIKPPMAASATTAKQGINLTPGSYTVVERNEPVTPLFNVNVNLQHLQEKILDLQDRIKRAYSADLFMMLERLEDKSMTAQEVLQRKQEQLQQLGPVVQRLQFEFLRKIIERVYNILDRAGILPQPEDAELALALSQEEVTIEYISPLAQAQKMAGMTNIEQAIAFTGQLAQFDQSVLDKIDFAKTIDSYFDMVGAPASIKRTEGEYEAIQQQKAQAMAEAKQQEQMAQAVQMAAPAAQAAKNITEAANDGNPALQEWLGGMM
ncbi:portal protein [Anaerovibrio slackiae]|uniref:portal protein n=2 Tax=Anaerovibrio TaxID=82373 RepID=UPI003870585D